MQNIEERIENFKQLKNQHENITRATKIIIDALKANKKILFCGNGGSASDCNHLACEFISKFKKERKSLPAISLCSNNSIITAIGNDLSFDYIFKRQIEGLGEKNDVLVAITTSGKSKNVLEAVKQARKQDMKVIFLTGKNKIELNADCQINVPSEKTEQIQEMHIAIGHIICEKTESEF